MIDIFSWIVLLTMVASGLGIFIYLGLWPGKVAKQRNHPYVDAITIGSWVLLIAGGVLWPLMLIWAYATPTVNNASIAGGNDK
jgi:prepilin signal peptidase PulO-like enzyme (type II secretory pathway)